MKDKDGQAEPLFPQRGQHRPDRSQAWMCLTYDYLRSLLGQLDDVMDLAEARNHAGIRHIAHRAKGTSGTYGLQPIAEEFARLEEAAVDCSPSDIRGLVSAIRQLIEAEIQELHPQDARSGRNRNGDADG